MFDLDFGIGLNLTKDVRIGVVGTIRAVHHKYPSPARLEFELLERVREAVWPPPARKAIRLLERSEYLSRVGR